MIQLDSDPGLHIHSIVALANFLQSQPGVVEPPLPGKINSRLQASKLTTSHNQHLCGRSWSLPDVLANTISRDHRDTQKTKAWCSAASERLSMLATSWSSAT